MQQARELMPIPLTAKIRVCWDNDDATWYSVIASGNGIYQQLAVQ